MKIQEGAYYRMRGDGKNLGQVVGPMYPVAYGVYAWGCAAFFVTETGRYDVDSESEYDLISEVYVSDTPPSDEPAAPPDSPKGSMLKPQVWYDLKPIEPSLGTKTLRDELEEKAALAILSGYYANPSLGPSKDTFGDVWDAAKQFVEARKK